MSVPEIDRLLEPKAKVARQGTVEGSGNQSSQSM